MTGNLVCRHGGEAMSCLCEVITHGRALYQGVRIE